MRLLGFSTIGYNKYINEIWLVMYLVSRRLQSLFPTPRHCVTGASLPALQRAERASCSRYFLVFYPNRYTHTHSDTSESICLYCRCSRVRRKSLVWSRRRSTGCWRLSWDECVWRRRISALLSWRPDSPQEMPSLHTHTPTPSLQHQPSRRKTRALPERRLTAPVWSVLIKPESK